MIIPFPCAIGVFGPSLTGKSKLIERMLTQPGVFSQMIERVVYCARHISSVPAQLRSDPRVEFSHQLPGDEALENHSGQATMYVIDDFLDAGAFDNDVVSTLCTSGRHLNLGLIITSQLLFPRAKKARNISTNLSHMIIFRNFRDTLSISNLSRQISPRNSAALASIVPPWEGYGHKPNEASRNQPVGDRVGNIGRQ